MMSAKQEKCTWGWYAARDAGSTAWDQGAVHEAGKGQQGRLGIDREIGVCVNKHRAAWHSRHLVADGIGVPAHDIIPTL